MVLAVRLKKVEERRLNLMSKRRHLNRSDAAMDLMARGFFMYLLEEYKSGNLSLGKMAENLGIPVAETLNLTARFGGRPDIPTEFMAEAWETTRTIFHLRQP